MQQHLLPQSLSAVINSLFVFISETTRTKKKQLPNWPTVIHSSVYISTRKKTSSATLVGSKLRLYVNKRATLSCSDHNFLITTQPILKKFCYDRLVQVLYLWFWKVTRHTHTQWPGCWKHRQADIISRHWNSDLPESVIGRTNYSQI